MHRAATILSAAALATAAGGCGERERGPRVPDGPPPAATPTTAGDLFRLRPVACGLAMPIQVLADPLRRRGMLLVERAGVVRRLRACGAPGRDRSLLDIRRLVGTKGEQGLLAVAFHPSFPADRRMFVHYSDLRGNTVVASYDVRGGRALPRTRRVLLGVEQPHDNHNGGSLAFGRDGRLYLGLGDGGGAFDADDRSQDPRSRLGKLLRHEPASGRWITVASGLRNPWRFAFDRATGDLWIGDVGQDRSEEVDRIERSRLAAATAGRPLNLGWPAYEGTERMPDRRLVADGPLVFPVATYGRRAGCSITGGFVYRGRAIRALRGRYVYGDFCTGRLWSLRMRSGRPEVRLESERLPQLVSFGEDARGELYAVSMAGRVVRLAG